MDAPTSAPFSRTTTRISRPFSCSSCFSRMAALRPAGPAPTMQTSTSSLGRSTLLGSKSSRLRDVEACSERASLSGAGRVRQRDSMLEVESESMEDEKESEEVGRAMGRMSFAAALLSSRPRRTWFYPAVSEGKCARPQRRLPSWSAGPGGPRRAVTGTQRARDWER